MSCLEVKTRYRGFTVKVFSDESKPNNKWCWFVISPKNLVSCGQRELESISKCLDESEFSIDEYLEDKIPCGRLFVWATREVE